MYTVGYEIDDAGKQVLLNIARSNGICSTCSNPSGGLNRGFRAEVRGTITELGTNNGPHKLMLTSAQISNNLSNVCQGSGSTPVAVPAPVMSPSAPTPAGSPPVPVPTTAGNPQGPGPTPINNPPVPVPTTAGNPSPVVTPTTSPPTDTSGQGFFSKLISWFFSIFGFNRSTF